MPSTYTLNNGIELIATGEQSGTWGDTTNTNFELLDTALDGQVSVTLAATGSSGSPNTLPISDGASSNGRNRLVIFGDGGDLGGTAFVQLTPNDAEKIIYVRNNLAGSRSILLFQGTYNASNDYEVPAGTTAVVFFDGAGSGAVAANVFNNAFFDSLRLGSVSVDKILDEDNMASNDAAALATQQSIKAYVDSQVGTVDTLAEILANGNTTGGTNIVVSVDDVISLDNGTNALPSLTTTGDLNTGIYFPAADEVGITTGGTQRVKVDSTGVDVTGQVDVNSAARIDSSGIVKAANGTAAAPTHAFLNDPDNGMYRNTTNTIGFATAGTDALIIDSSQRVLINGVASTQIRTRQAVLQSNGTSSDAGASFTRWTNGGGGPYLTFAHSRSATVNGGFTILQDDDALGSIDFAGADGTDLTTPGATITASVDGTPGANDMPGRLVFSTTADGATSVTERMRIDSQGFVGINQTTPQNNLDIKGTGGSTAAKLRVGGATGSEASGFRIDHTNSGSTTSVLENLYYSTSSAAVVTLRSSVLKFESGTSADEAMRIDSSQRVLMGTNPSSVAIASSAQAIMQVHQNATTISASFGSFNNNVGGPVIALGHSRSTTVGTPGTVVSSGDSLGTFRWAGDDGTDMQTQSAKINVAVDGTPGSNDMPGRLEFYTTADGASSATERMRISSNGNVGIGGVGPERPLVLYDGSSGQTQIQFQNSTTGTTSADGFGVGLDTAEEGFIWNYESSDIYIGNTTAGRMITFDAGGSVLIGSNSAPETTLSGGSPNFQVTGSVFDSYGSFTRRQASTQYGSGIILAKSRNASANSYTIVQDDDILGSVIFIGDDGTDLDTYGATIAAEVDGTPGANDMPSRLVFKTTADGANSPTERMRIQSDGFVGIGGGGTQAYYPLHVYNNSDGIITRWRKQGATNNPLFEIELTESDSSTILRTSGSNVGPMIFQRGSSEAMRITTNQVVLLGATESRTVQGFTHKQQIEGTNASTASLSIVRNTNSVDPPYISFGKTRSGSVGGSAIVQQDDVLGRFDFTGANGSNLNNIAVRIDSRVDGAPGSSTDMPGRIVFQTSADGTASPTERVRITNAGAMGFDAGSASIHAMRVGTSAGSATDCFELDLPSGTFAAYVDVVTNQNGGYAGRTSQFLWYARRATAGASRNVVELTTNSLGSVNSGVVAVGTITASATNPTGTKERFRITTQYATDTMYCIVRVVGNPVNTLKILN